MTDTANDWIDVGPVTELPDGGCAAAADDRVLLIRHGETVLAFVNRCLHRDTPLHDGHVVAGTVACPLHHWRYDLRDGGLVGGNLTLPSIPVEVREGRVAVRPPEEHASVGQLLRDHARTWSREDVPLPRTGGSATVGARRPPSRREEPS